MQNQTISIIIPAKNEEKYIGKCLKAINTQSQTSPLEIIVIDSGSTDKTAEIARSFEKVRVISIRSNEFRHGLTRNLGASETKGDILVFLNADALPADTQWLFNLTVDFKSNLNLVATYSKHLPKSDCSLYMQNDLMKPMSFSTVSCAIRKNVWERMPFSDEIEFAEDLEWGLRAMHQDLDISFKPTSLVIHSHNYSPSQLFNIKYQLGKAYKSSIHSHRNPIQLSILAFAATTFKICDDMFFISRYKTTMDMKLRQILLAICARISGNFGKLLGEIYG